MLIGKDYKIIVIAGKEGIYIFPDACVPTGIFPRHIGFLSPVDNIRDSGL
jgi:hypothetical protein